MAFKAKKSNRDSMMIEVWTDNQYSGKSDLWAVIHIDFFEYELDEEDFKLLDDGNEVDLELKVA